MTRQDEQAPPLLTGGQKTVFTPGNDGSVGRAGDDVVVGEELGFQGHFLSPPEGSVGPAGDSVRDEASRGKRRGVLVPVTVDPIEAPLGFGEIEPVDLTRWRGRRRDPHFRDLVATVRAKIEGRPVPRARGPVMRLVRRATFGALSMAALTGLYGFGRNVLRVQNRLCTAPFVPIEQPRSWWFPAARSAIPKWDCATPQKLWPKANAQPGARRRRSFGRRPTRS